MDMPRAISGDEGVELRKPLLAWGTGAIILVGLYLSSRYNYLLFHTIAEMFSVIISCGIFLIAWNTRAFLNNDYLLTMGVASLFVAVLDLAHTLSYSGMPIFPGYGANAPTELWIAARYLMALSLLAALFLLHRRVDPRLLLLTYSGVTVALLLSIFVWRVFPDCYREGEGLTPFKRVSEYVICLILAGGLYGLFRNRQAFDPGVLRCLAWAILLTIVSELAFTFYVSVSGLSNLIGHFLKIITFYLIYKAVIETGLQKPYSLLLRHRKLAEEELERLVRERTASLQETTDQLNSLVYTIAHDLRAPLRAQQGYAQILIEENGPALGAEGREWLQRIIQAAVRLDALVCGLLSYAAVCREKPPLKPLDLSPVVDQVRAELADQARALGATIDTAAVQAIVSGDESSVRAAVEHLLSNALRFAKLAEPPRVKLWTERREGWVRLWIEDNGVGIDERYRSKLFGVFQRLPQAELRPGAGTGLGLGLALVKRNIERIGGRVGVESNLGEGSRFWVELKPALADRRAE